tara:strand:- start:10718 stop:10879 length:162 start_codon:yes stop_codon:yes gene_type:complete
VFKKKNSVRFARVLTSVSRKLENIGAVKTALWLEKRAESFDKNLVADNVLKRF